MQKVKIDYDKMSAVLKEVGKTKKWLSLELGRYESYIGGLKQNPELPQSVERIICMLLGLEPGSLIAEEVQKESGEAAILHNIYREVKEERKMIDSALERLEQIWNKLNTNTIQLERVRDCVKGFEKTDFEKAVEFLRKALSGDKVNAEEVMMRSDAAGIKRADLLKAKRELGADHATTGYGKSQKTWWFIPK